MSAAAALAASPRPQGGAVRSRRALAGLNFALADVRDGLGPFLGIMLIQHGWGPGRIGLAMTLGGLAGMAATTPLGALADASRAKRSIVIVCSGLIIAASLLLLLTARFELVVLSQVATGVAGAAIGPAVAGITLGMVGQGGLARQLGINEAWNHGGNVVAAAAGGLAAYFFGITAIFVMMSLMGLGSIFMALAIRPRDIDHDVARGLDKGARDQGEHPSGLGVLFGCTPLLIVGATMMLFHLANGAMLPLLGQAVAARGAAHAGAFTAGTIVVAQLTMIPVALLASRVAQRRGYWLLLAAALAVLPVRGLIAGLWPDPWAMIPVQVLDGVGAGLLGVVTPGLVARILKGTGHVNAGLGAVMTLQGVGAASSPALAGFVAAHFGYAAAFLVLAAIAVAGLVLWLACASKTRSACAIG